MSPPEMSADDEVRCPHCAATFVLSNAVEVSLPQLIRVQQQHQKPDPFIHDTAQSVPWGLWADLVVDETSLDDIPVGQFAPHLTDHEVHHIERAPHDDASFQTTVTPAKEKSDDEDDDDDDNLFEFVIEGDEASKIFSKQELELAAEESSENENTPTSDSKRTFDLAFDETLLTEEETQKIAQKSAPKHDIFDFEAEAGELEPGEFELEPSFEKFPIEKSREITLAATPKKPQPTATPQQRPMVAFDVSRIGTERRTKSQTRLAAFVAIAGFFILPGLYYFMNLVGGPEYNFLGIDMPGCADTTTENETPNNQNENTPTISKRELAKNQKKLQSGINTPRNTEAQSTTVYHPIGGRIPGQEENTTTPRNNDQAKNTLYTNTELLIPGGFDHDKSHPQFQLPEGGAGLITYPLYDVRELEATLTATHEEFGCAECQSTGYLSRSMAPGSDTEERLVICDICNGNPPNLMTMRGYNYFCQLGQAATFFKDNSPRGIEAKHQVDEILKKTVKSEHEYSELGQLTIDKIIKPLHPNEGIMITGQVRVVKPNNGLYGAIIGVPDSDTKLTVLSDRPFPFVAGDRVVLAGVIVLDSTKNIAGFTTTQKPWIIWYGTSVNIPETLPN